MKAGPQHRDFHSPYSLREVRGFFNVPGNHYREDAGVRD